jgi:hypothetical protein
MDTRIIPTSAGAGPEITFSPYLAGGFLGGDTQIYGFSLEAAHFFHLWKDTICNCRAQSRQWIRGAIKHHSIYDKLFLGGSNDLRASDFTM